MLLELVLATLITSKIQTANLEGKNDIRNTNLASYILGSDTDGSRSFSLGDSLVQVQEKEIQRNRDVLSRGSRSYTVSESYTGKGTAEIVGKDTQYFNCVAYAKAKTGIERPIGAGGRAGINSYEPQVGAIGAEKGVAHAVFIEKIEGDKITITEANWKRGWITRRVLSRSDFIGFII